MNNTMTKRQRFLLINNSKTKLDLIYNFRNSFKYYDKEMEQFISCNYNFSDLYEYFKRMDIPVKMTSLLRMKLTTHTRLSPSYYFQA